MHYKDRVEFNNKLNEIKGLGSISYGETEFEDTETNVTSYFLEDIDTSKSLNHLHVINDLKVVIWHYHKDISTSDVILKLLELGFDVKSTNTKEQGTDFYLTTYEGYIDSGIGDW